jgi:hypothetical protein
MSRWRIEIRNRGGAKALCVICRQPVDRVNSVKVHFNPLWLYDTSSLFRIEPAAAFSKEMIDQGLDILRIRIVPF